MAGKNEFRTLPPTLESFGIAIDFLARFEPFTTAELGAFSRSVRRQVLGGQHVIAWDGTNLNGYAGWLPTTKADAEAWLADRGPLKPADDNADAVALTTVAVEDQRLVRHLMREARKLNPGLRVFFKRSYSDATKSARKSAVQNVGPASGRPAIADDPCGFLFALAERAPGRTERVAVGEEAVLIVQDAAIARYVLVDNVANYTKNFASFTPLLGASRLTLDGERWRRSQRLTQPTIAPHDVARAEAILVERYAQFAEALLEKADPGIAVDGIIDRAAVGTLANLAFSTQFEDFGQGFVADLRTVIRYCARRSWDLRGVPVAVDETELATAQAATARIREVVRALVDKRRAHPGEAHDALSALIEGADRLADAPEDQRIDLTGEIVTLIVAGSDTTSAAIGWALSILAEHQSFQEHLRDELSAVVSTRPPTLADVEKIPSLKPLLDETLRMFPSVPILSRFAVAEDDIGGHKVAPGDRVLVSVIGLHQNPAAWESPREFRLERHMAEAASRPDRRSVFMPFSAGPRICGGARFAQMEMSLALMLVLQRCRLELPAPLPLTFDWGASMRRRGGQILRVTAL